MACVIILDDHSNKKLECFNHIKHFETLNASQSTLQLSLIVGTHLDNPPIKHYFLECKRSS